MEDLEECLLIAKIEVSCWEDQPKQVVSQFQFINMFQAIPSISIQSQAHHSNNPASGHILPLSRGLQRLA